MTITAVVVTYNSSRVIRSCLAALSDAAAESPSLGLRVVVVDNGSTDETLDIVRETTSAQLIVEDSNPGFGAGVNRGVQACAADSDLLLVNPDAVVTASVLERAVGRFEMDESIGIAGFGMVLPDGSRGLAGGPTPTVTKEVLAWLGVDRLATPAVRRLLVRMGSVPGFSGFAEYLSTTSNETSVPTAWVSGFCALVRREAWDRVGGFDERFFLYFEDADLCLRIREQGWRVVTFPDLAVYHDESSSTATRGKRRFQAQGLQMFMSIHGNALQKASSTVFRWLA